jgi:hypothetical protein
MHFLSLEVENFRIDSLFTGVDHISLLQDSDDFHHMDTIFIERKSEQVVRLIYQGMQRFRSYLSSRNTA